MAHYDLTSDSTYSVIETSLSLVDGDKLDHAFNILKNT